jgi:hypothetical protein
MASMKSSTIEKDISKQLNLLPHEQQQQVLEFARNLVKSRVRGLPGQNLLHFAGTIDHEDLIIIQETIKEGCEKVNLDEW